MRTTLLIIFITVIVFIGIKIYQANQAIITPVVTPTKIATTTNPFPCPTDCKG